MHRRLIILGTLFGVALLAGCGGHDRFVGRWTGAAQASAGPRSSVVVPVAVPSLPFDGPSSLVLKPGGTGYLKVGGTPEQAIRWTEDGNKLVLHGANASVADSGAGTSTASSASSVIGTLASNGDYMNLDLGLVTVALRLVSHRT